MYCLSHIIGSLTESLQGVRCGYRGRIERLGACWQAAGQSRQIYGGYGLTLDIHLIPWEY